MTRKPSQIINVFPLAFIAICSLWLPALSNGAGFDYDELGRLIRYVDKNGQATHYNHDQAGNLLGVENSGLATPPVIDITSSAIRCGEAVVMRIQGSGLEGVRVIPSIPGVQISEILSSPDEVIFMMKVEDCSLIGAYTLSFQTAGGSVDLDLGVDPALPEVFISPAPLAIPPDGSQRAFILRLTHADTITHNFALSVSDPTIASLTQNSLTIPAGQKEAYGAIAGLTAGQAVLTLDSPTLGTTTIPLFVLADFAGVNTSYGGIFEVVKEYPPVSTSFTVSGMMSAQVGVVFGTGIEGLNPDRMTTGTGPLPLEISGMGLDSVTNIIIQPPDGVVLGSLTLAADGRSATVPITVAENAPTTMRRVVLESAGGSILPASPGADRLQIVPPRPEIHSIDPIILQPGDTGRAFTIRGARLWNAQMVQVTPSDHISIGTSSVNANGTLLSTTISLSPAAAQGERIVIVVTDGGSSNDIPSPANTIRIALEAGDTITPLSAPVVGVVKDSAQLPPQPSYTLHGTQLGIIKGSAVTGVEPSAGIIGRDYLLSVNGAGLAGADTVTFDPPAGIAVTNPPTVAADGRSLSVNITIAADAPETIRQLKVQKAGAAIPAAPLSTSQFRVTPPPPEISSVSPLFLTTGTISATLTLRGRFFDNVQQLRLLPGSGVTMGSVSVHDGSTRITAQINIAADAPTGPRVVQVITPGGESSAIPSVENSINIVTQLGPTYTALAAPVVGVSRLDDQPPAEAVVPVLSPLLGIVVTEPEQPVTSSALILASQIGIAVGPVAKEVVPQALLRGTTGTLTVSGEYLQDVNQIELQPADGVIVGNTVSVATDGRSATVSIDIDPAAPPGQRKVILRTPLGVIPFSNAGAASFTVGQDAPEILSIDPILAGQGDTFTLLIRGSNLFTPESMIAEPPEGMVFGDSAQGNAAGTEVRVQVSILPDAPLGSRVIRVAVPGAVTSPLAKPANSFTIYASVPN